MVCQSATVLGHRSNRITTHYSAAELANLIEAANRVWESSARKKPTLAPSWLHPNFKGRGLELRCKRTFRSTL